MRALVGQVQVELTLFLRDKTILFFSLFFPLVTVAFFGYLNREGQVGEVSYPSFVIAGGIGMVVASAAFENLSTALARQRDVGILKRLGGTPLRVWMLVGAKMLTTAAVTLAQTVLMVAVNVLLFKAETGGSIFWGLAVLSLGILTFTTMGIALPGCVPTPTSPRQRGWPLPCPCSFCAVPFSPSMKCHCCCGTSPRHCP